MVKIKTNNISSNSTIKINRWTLTSLDNKCREIKWCTQTNFKATRVNFRWIKTKCTSSSNFRVTREWQVCRWTWVDMDKWEWDINQTNFSSIKWWEWVSNSSSQFKVRMFVSHKLLQMRSLKILMREKNLLQVDFHSHHQVLKWTLSLRVPKSLFQQDLLLKLLNSFLTSTIWMRPNLRRRKGKRERIRNLKRQRLMKRLMTQLNGKENHHHSSLCSKKRVKLRIQSITQWILRWMTNSGISFSSITLNMVLLHIVYSPGCLLRLNNLNNKIKPHTVPDQNMEEEEQVKMTMMRTRILNQFYQRNQRN